MKTIKVEATGERLEMYEAPMGEDSALETEAIPEGARQVWVRPVRDKSLTETYLEACNKTGDVVIPGILEVYQTMDAKIAKLLNPQT